MLAEPIDIANAPIRPKPATASVLILLALLAWSAGCDRESAGADAGDAEHDRAEVSDLADLADEAVLDVVADTPPDGAGCSGDPPMCTFGCGGDAFLVGECEDGQWICPAGTTPMDDCPPGSCFGLPERGEVCTDTGWQCRPWENDALPACGAGEQRLCIDCAGFSAPYSGDDCDCTCNSGFVSCGAPPTCRAGSATTDFGVTFSIELADCAFTRAELEAGVTLGYTITLEDRGAWVWSRPLQAGGCDQPGPSGLRVLEAVRGDGQTWCVCDTGLCPQPERVDMRLEPGTYEGSITWDGRNWQGPSDTGNPPGEPFPPGEYLFTVRAAGFYGDEPGSDRVWDITATAPVYVLE